MFRSLVSTIQDESGADVQPVPKASEGLSEVNYPQKEKGNLKGNIITFRADFSQQKPK